MTDVLITQVRVLARPKFLATQFLVKLITKSQCWHLATVLVHVLVHTAMSWKESFEKGVTYFKHGNLVEALAHMNQV
jgi:hypothetical protein